MWSVAISLAFLTRHVLLSLGIAIAAGGLLTQVPHAPLSAGAWFDGLKTAGSLVGKTVWLFANPVRQPVQSRRSRHI